MMSTSNGKTGTLARYAPLAVLICITAVVFLNGWHKHLSLKTVGLSYEALKSYIDRNLASALLIYVGVYVALVALSLPGALIMTLSGGLLFGWKLGTPATVIGATVGATIVFLVARTSFGGGLAARAGPWVAKMRDGFQENALSYLLFLRLVPVPFFIVNLVPAVLGVKLGTYVLGTFLGIIPGTTAFSIAGAGLASVVEAQNLTYKACLRKLAEGGGMPCDYNIDTSQLVTPQLVAAFIALGGVALIPIAIKKWSKRNATV
jgi:uncharacterized membrane protein YdjX (TVP38/TMEM64 family)